VVGAIALIKPFHVPRVAFLRDVWFFTIAVILVVTVLHDGRLAIYESGAMVLLYVAYVGVVIFGNWWSRRQAQKETYQALGWEERHLPSLSALSLTSLNLAYSTLADPDRLAVVLPVGLRELSLCGVRMKGGEMRLADGDAWRRALGAMARKLIVLTVSI